MPSRRKAPRTVVIVEDDPVIALALELAFRDAGEEDVIVIARATEAVAALADIVPRILVLDLSLSDTEDGYGVAEIALQVFNPPPLLIFSTGAPERVPAALARAGSVYAKPYDPAVLARDALARAA